MSGSELETPRLRHRAWLPADEDPMAAINRDPEVPTATQRFARNHGDSGTPHEIGLLVDLDVALVDDL